jgi:hypothetical protein
MTRNLWRWLQGQMVQDVPDSVTVCEFDCRPVSCRRGEWERCEHRLRGSAIGLRHRMPWPARLESGPGGRGDRGRA